MILATETTERQEGMKEKEKIEIATVEAFLKDYNFRNKKCFKIIKHNTETEAGPDFECGDSLGDKLSIEVTCTEDRPGDMQAILGRSDHKSLNALKTHLEDVEGGKANVFDRVSCFQGNVFQQICSRINKKLLKDYGVNVALVIRDTSPLDWDWNLEKQNIKKFLRGKRNPYGKGIWVVSYSKDCIYHII